jgi:hypothetical protein
MTNQQATPDSKGEPISSYCNDELKNVIMITYYQIKTTQNIFNCFDHRYLDILQTNIDKIADMMSDCDGASDEILHVKNAMHNLQWPTEGSCNSNGDFRALVCNVGTCLTQLLRKTNNTFDLMYESDIYTIVTNIINMLARVLDNASNNSVFTNEEFHRLECDIATISLFETNLRINTPYPARANILARYQSVTDRFFQSMYEFSLDADLSMYEVGLEYEHDYTLPIKILIGALTKLKTMLREKPRKNRPKRRRRKIDGIANPLTMDVTSTHHPVLASGEIPDTILVKKTNTKSLYIVSDVARHIIINALKDGKFVMAPNQALDITDEWSQINNKKKFGVHQYPFHIWIRLDLHYGDKLEHTNRMENVDILGIHLHKDPVCILMSDIEIETRVNRELHRAAGTHHMCATGTCLHTFRKGTVEIGVEIQCPDCNVTQCVGCEEEYLDTHHGFTCDEVQTRKHMIGITCEYTLRGLIDGTLQPCPECGATTDRIDGCNKMHCANTNCNAFWCWACGTGDLKTKYPSDPYDHYRVHTAAQTANGLSVCSSVATANNDNHCFGSALDLVIARNRHIWPDLEERLASAVAIREAEEKTATTTEPIV